MRTFLLAFLTLLLAACGFRPLHEAVSASSLDAGSPLRSISVEPRFSDDADNKRGAFLIARSLEARLGEPDVARYTLTVTPRVVSAGLAVGRDDVASRFDLNIYASYSLRDADGGDVVTSGRTYSVATFGAPRDPYGRIAAEVSATEQAAERAADEIITELAVFFAEPAAPTSAKTP